MKSLREFAQFVGKPQSPISLRALVDYLRFPPGNLNPSALSVREIIQAFDGHTPPVALHQIRVQPTAHVVPFDISMQMGNHDGYIISTRWRILRGGQQVAVYDTFHPFITSHTFREGDADQYTIDATIKAIGRDGYAEATRSVQILAKPKTEPPPPQKLSISVTANQSNGVPNGAFTVTGSGFLPNTTVHIRVVDDALKTLFFDQTSSAQGTLNFVSGKLCQFPGKLHFSANDGRSDPNDLTGTLWSNTVEMTCF